MRATCFPFAREENSSPYPSGEQSSSRVTPIPAILFTYAGKSLIIDRVGQTWLPIGSPSGAAETFEAPAARTPAAPAKITAFSMNSRLEIGAMAFLLPVKPVALNHDSTLSQAAANR